MALTSPALLLLLLVLVPSPLGVALLYPQASETRQVVSLDGVWRFRTSPLADPDRGFKKHWFAKGLEASEDADKEVIQMPVPSSYNDITQDKSANDSFSPPLSFFRPAPPAFPKKHLQSLRSLTTYNPSRTANCT